MRTFPRKFCARDEASLLQCRVAYEISGLGSFVEHVMVNELCESTMRAVENASLPRMRPAVNIHPYRPGESELGSTRSDG
jgi:hypothetical protein